MKNTIDVEQIRAAAEELADWQRARADHLARIADEEDFFRLRVLPKAHRNSEGESFAPTSAFLVNTVLQKHADMMENIPTAVCLAREPDDRKDAEALSAILPVILERSHFEQAYSENMWHKLKHGSCAFGVFWNGSLENGLGDIDVRRIDLRNLFWQPSVADIQNSRAVYLIERMEQSDLCAAYPQLEAVDPRTLSQNGDGTVTVVDRYYKKRQNGRTVLHYCKFVGEHLLFATENEPSYEQGWYEHGQYPFVLDTLYPIEDDCLGFGIIALARDPQQYIDRMDRNLLEYMDWATRVRFFCKKSTGVNEQAFSDLSRRIVEVEGDPDEERLRQIRVDDLDGFWLDLKNAKIDELKETTSNRNILQGAADGGVVAASAIAALQEAGNKTVRDMVAASYRSFVRVAHLIIECVRQFYTEARYFRVLGKHGEWSYLHWSNGNITERVIGTAADGTPLCRRPVFDIDVRAEKKDPYTRLSHNETLKDLYKMGVFDPQNAAAAGVLLSAMDFAGVERLREQVAMQAHSKEGTVRAQVSGESVADSTAALAVQAQEEAAALRERAILAVGV